jgi:D-inositol-3-phosphate glycosyltransferase
MYYKSMNLTYYDTFLVTHSFPHSMQGLIKLADLRTILLIEPAGAVMDGNNEAFLNQLSSLGYRSIYVRKGKSKLAYFLKTATKLLFCRYDVIHIHSYGGNFPNSIFLFIARMLGRRSVLVVHDVDLVDTKGIGHGMKHLHRECLLADKVVALSNRGRRELEAFCDKDKVIQLTWELVPQWTAYDQEYARKRMGIPSAAFVYLFYGQLRKSKGIELLVGAFERICSVNEHFHLVVAGIPRDVDLSIFSIIPSHRITLITKFTTQEEKDLLFSSANIVVMPYIQCYQSGVLLDALSRGIPAIASDVEYFKNYITHGVNGYLVKAGDQEHLESAMIRAYKDGFREQEVKLLTDDRMRAQARKYVSVYFE